MEQTSFPAEPALLKGATREWRAHRRWSWDFIGSLADETLALTDAHGEPAGEAGLVDYLQALQAGEGPLASLYA